MRSVAFAFALAAASLAEPAIGQDRSGPVVVRANGPVSKAVTVGEPLPANAAIELVAGDVLTLLGPAGVRVLRGPGRLSGERFTSTGEPEVAEQRTALGATRGFRVKPKPPAEAGTMNGPVAEEPASGAPETPALPHP